MQTTTCEKIGKILTMADDIHFSYYEYGDRLSAESVPDVLAGGDCLSIVISNPLKGLKFLKKRMIPFLKFCESVRKRSDSKDKDRAIYGSYVKKFNSFFEEIIEEINIDGNYCVDNFSKNIIMIEYFN